MARAFPQNHAAGDPWKKAGRYPVDTTRIASQAFRMPKLKGASLPPVIARSVTPVRTIQKAWPMAWAAEEHAVEMVKLGPVMPNSMEIWLAPALAMVLGMVKRVHAVVAQLVDVLETDVFGALSAHARAGNDGGRLAQFRRPFDAGVGDGLARGDHGELREAVDEIGAAVVEVGRVRIAAHLGAIVKPKLGDIGGFDGADAAAGLPPAPRDELGDVLAKRADGAHAGDRNAAHALLGDLRRRPTSPDTRRSTPSHMPLTPRTDRTSSSGMLMSNSFSSAKRISTASMESIPNSRKLLSMVIDSARNPLGSGNRFDDPLNQLVGHRS